MPDIAEPQVAVDLPETATQTRRVESAAVFWLLVAGGALLLLMGWLLPWFVEQTASGIGHSPMDVIVSSPTGVGWLAVWVMGVCMLALIAGLGYDVYAVMSRRVEPFRFARIRAGLAVLGAACVLLILILVSSRTELIFGNLTPNALVDNAVWIMLTGFLLIAFAYGARSWVVSHGGLAFAAVAFAIGGLFPLMFHQAPGFVVWGAQSAGIYILLALGLNVVVGFAGLLDLGYAAFFAIGAYTTASMASATHGLHWPFWIIIFIGAAAAGLFGAILGFPTLRLRGDYLAIVTLGFGEIVPDMAQNNLFGDTGGPNGISGVDTPSLLPGLGRVDIFGSDPRPYFYAILVVIVLVVLLMRNVERSRLGRAWVAIREDEVAASATGINTVTTKLLAFAIGAAVSGFAGAFFGAMLSSVTPDNFQFAVSVTALTTVVLGGIGNITGVIVGAILVSFVIFWVLPELQGWMGTVGSNVGVTQLGTIQYSDYKFIVYGLILIGIMLLRPSGLLPSRARKVELETGAESEPLAAVQERA
ncbi:MAG TPA: branched-chain amino acid ABC transporter permease [Candidatus Angelobacter sp.]|nr:branched-chain amino acid ABC transporter permease [Candidatus Angelobacter sp.]